MERAQFGTDGDPASLWLPIVHLPVSTTATAAAPITNFKTANATIIGLRDRSAGGFGFRTLLLFPASLGSRPI